MILNSCFLLCHRVQSIVLSRKSDSFFFIVSRSLSFFVKAATDQDQLHRNDEDQNRDAKCYDVWNQGTFRDTIGHEIRPCQATETVEEGSKVNELIDCLVDEVGGGDRSSVAVEHGVFLCPVHTQIAEHSCKDANGLQGDVEANKHEQVDHVDVLVSYLELNSFVNGVVFSLILVEFAG